MRAREHGFLTVAALSLSLLAAQATPGRAQTLFGHAQGQYQRFEEIVQFRDSSGAVSDRRRIREFLLQNYELRNQTLLRSGLQIQTNLRYSDLSYSNLPDGSRSPQGLLRLNHRLFAFSASHRPTTTTSGVGREGTSAPGDTARLLSVTSRSQETMFTGALFPERGPRLDLMWTRQHRDGDELGPGAKALNRTARLGYDRGPLRLYGMFGDLERTPEVAGGQTTDQRTLTGGGNLTFSPLRAVSVALQVDVADARTTVPGQPVITTRTQGGSLNSSYRPNRIVDLGLNYTGRHSTYFNRVGHSTSDQDGSLVLNLTPRRALRITTAGGLRTARDPDGDEDLARYLSAVVTGDGYVRPGWHGNGAASHTFNWDPQRGRYSTDALRSGSRFRLARRLDAEVNGQVTAVGDTASVDQRWTSELAGRLTATPLNGFAFAYAERVFRVGPTLGRATGRATTRQVDLRWKPVTALEMVGSLGQTHPITGSGQRLRTETAMVRWTLFSGWQLVGNWSHSQQARLSSFAEQLTGREVAGVRLAGVLGRRLTFNAGATVADRGKSRETRQYDGSMTMTFGR